MVPDDDRFSGPGSHISYCHRNGDSNNAGYYKFKPLEFNCTPFFTTTQHSLRQIIDH